MAETCDFPGNGDMYGLGIRVGYYLQWYGVLIAAWICPREVPTLRLTNTFFVASTFLALLTQVPKQANLEVVEIYITLLFTFGSSLYLLPILLWRIVTRCHSRLDPTRFPRAPPPSRVFSFLNSFLLVAVMVFQTWFWVKRVSDLDLRTCSQYGFLFKRIPLDSRPFRIVNLALSLLLLVVILGFCMATPCAALLERKLKIDGKGKLIKPHIVKTYQIFDTVSKLLIATTIVSATELCIHWNQISGVNSINSAGQTIPLVIGIGNLVRIIYVAIKSHFFAKKQDESDVQVQATQSGHPPAPWRQVPHPYAEPSRWDDISMQQPMPVQWDDLSVATGDYEAPSHSATSLPGNQYEMETTTYSGPTSPQPLPQRSSNIPPQPGQPKQPTAWHDTFVMEEVD
ncbi:hypothetical protein BCR34DRAFT_383813 [Clohesyomyces aquaticus]|uniref:Uncharacterized protein n=1 Tax=Clohesyomyces aquaticus TaxID=1231657 RepID=A0A1Y1ZH11_9PLEO|nr:hypothetical protein BCR34DRAFT_383813 [Clohesyomyces aquaticus]